MHQAAQNIGMRTDVFETNASHEDRQPMIEPHFALRGSTPMEHLHIRIHGSLSHEFRVDRLYQDFLGGP